MQSLQRRALSEVLPEGGRSGRRREEARQVEFVRVGQALKLDTIVKGDAPTSLANTGLFRRSVRSFLFPGIMIRPRIDCMTRFYDSSSMFSF